jgi:hypothetical protein
MVRNGVTVMTVTVMVRQIGLASIHPASSLRNYGDQLRDAALIAFGPLTVMLSWRLSTSLGDLPTRHRGALHDRLITRWSEKAEVSISMMQTVEATSQNEVTIPIITDRFRVISPKDFPILC